jgi:hypothetical protein
MSFLVIRKWFVCAFSVSRYKFCSIRIDSMICLNLGRFVWGGLYAS